MTSVELDVLAGGLREVARRLNWSERKTYLAAERGELPFLVKIGGHYVVPRRAFEKWCEAPNRELEPESR